MKLFKSTALIVALLFTVQSSALASDHDNALDKFKKYINTMVQRVKKSEVPADKRKIMNYSFDHLKATFDKVSSIGMVSQKDKKAIMSLERNVENKQNELNGKDGYEQVSNSELNNFANFVQQDLEQADSTITISVTVLLLIVIILILL